MLGINKLRHLVPSAVRQPALCGLRDYHHSGNPAAIGDLEDRVLSYPAKEREPIHAMVCERNIVPLGICYQ